MQQPDDLDLTLRHVSRQFPEHLARALLPPGTAITAVSWYETQLTARQRRLDRALDVTADGKRRIEHNEWQVEMQSDVPFRIFEYNVLTALALEAETPAGGTVPPIESTLVLLSGRDLAWPEYGEYRTSPKGGRFSGVTYRIDAVYQRTVAELEARGSPLWLIFAPLAVDADPVRMKAIVDRLRAESPPREFQELAVALSVVADADKRERGLGDIIVGLLKEETVMESTIFRMGKQHGRDEAIEQGLQKGVALLVRQFERRLGRTLVAEERGTLVRRLDSLGPDRLGDVVLDLTPEALATWLATPDAA